MRKYNKIKYIYIYIYIYKSILNCIEERMSKFWAG
jgi:hypothetical protein